MEPLTFWNGTAWKYCIFWVLFSWTNYRRIPWTKDVWILEKGKKDASLLIMSMWGRHPSMTKLASFLFSWKLRKIFPVWHLIALGGRACMRIVVISQCSTNYKLALWGRWICCCFVFKVVAVVSVFWWNVCEARWIMCFSARSAMNRQRVPSVFSHQLQVSVLVTSYHINI